MPGGLQLLRTGTGAEFAEDRRRVAAWEFLGINSKIGGFDMYNAMQGVRVLEVATWWFVPTAGAIMADWGADVIKVEHPEVGDPMRANQRGYYTTNGRQMNFMFEQSNRGKRSIGLDISTPEGLEVLYELARKADVFSCNFLPEVRRRLGIDIDDIRKVNPQIIYARGSGYGPNGPEAETPAFDFTASWARGGLAYVHRNSPDDVPLNQRGAYADTIASLALAGGMAAALFRRSVSGESTVVDVSLLGVTAWLLSVDVVASRALDVPMLDMGNFDNPNNPLHCMYRTKDGGWIAISMPQSDRYWPTVMRLLDRPELIDDPRFRTSQLRFRNLECAEVIRQAFATATVAEWRDRLKDFHGPWDVVQAPADLHGDEQILANEYVKTIKLADGAEVSLVAAPVQFDTQVGDTGKAAPDHADQTEKILSDVLGYDEAKILDLKIAQIVT